MEQINPAYIARKYLGKTEKPGNAGFHDAEFERKMTEVGFMKTHAWCAYFAELVAKEAIPAKFAEFDRLFSGSAVTTFNNFMNAGYKASSFPQVGNLVIWQRFNDGKAHWSGHAGIVDEVISPTQFVSIEGNTNDRGGREGYIVAPHVRLTHSKPKFGLHLKGFIDLTQTIHA